MSIIGTFDIICVLKWEIEQEEQRGGRRKWRMRLRWLWISEGGVGSDSGSYVGDVGSGRSC